MRQFRALAAKHLDYTEIARSFKDNSSCYPNVPRFLDLGYRNASYESSLATHFYLLRGFSEVNWDKGQDTFVK